MQRSSYNSRRRKIRNRRIAAVVIAIAVIALAIFITYKIVNRQTLEGAEITENYSIENNVSSVTRSETQRFYQIDIFTPDFENVKVPEEMKSFAAQTEADFRKELDNLYADGNLNKKDKATLNISYTAESFRQFTTYIVSVDTHVSDMVPYNEHNSKEERCYAVNTDTGLEYTAASLFEDDYDYKLVLANKIEKKMDEKGLADAIDALDNPFDKNVFMTADGLRVVFDQNIGDSIKAGDSVNVEYKYIYYGLSFELPDEYKPPEPTPIDPKKEKVVALTFDDGPSSTVTPKLLDLLKEEGVKATFFVEGDFVNANPDVLKREADEGHCIGLHTMHHDYSWVKNTQGAIANLQEEEDLVYEICGKRPYLYRPPGGIMNTALCKALGRPAILWDVDPLDWKVRDADAIYNNVMSEVTSGDIVLSHDLYEPTYQAYKRIIPELKKRGYRFVTVEELLGITDPSIEGAYAGEMIYYRNLAYKLRSEGKFEN